MRKIEFIIIACAFFPALIPAAGADGLFTEIEIRGLRLLDRSEILGGINAEVRDRSMSIDIKALRVKLDKMPFIESYSIKTGNSRLILEINERVPLFIYRISGVNENVFYEVDEALRVLSSNRIHDRSRPLLFSSRLTTGGIPDSSDMKRIASELFAVRRDEPGFYSQLSSIEILDGSLISIRLKNRNTEFIMENSRINFGGLKCLTGYLDRTGRYPGIINISSDAIIVR